MKGPTLLTCAAFCLILPTAVYSAEPTHARLDESQRAFFRDYCYECHDAKTQEGKLRLDDISLTIASVEQADRWQKILNQLNSGEMPPEGSKQPDRARKTELLDALSQTLVQARRILSDQGGRITLRRLNRREYVNTIRDLLGVEIDARDLPADGGTGSFDTVGASLYMSSDQIEQYLALGRKALDEHFGRSTTKGKKPLQARQEAEVVGNRRMNGVLRETTASHERYVRWTTAVDEAAARPENVKLAAELRERALKPLPESGIDTPSPLHFYYNWKQIQGAPSPTDFGFRDAQDGYFKEIQHEKYIRYYLDYQDLPQRDTGAWLLFYQAYREEYVKAGTDWPAGRYTLRIRVAANTAAPQERRFIEVGQRGADVSDFTVFSAHQVLGTLAEPQTIELTVDVPSAGNREFAVREKRPNSRTAEIRSYYDVFEKTGRGPIPALWLDWVEVEGPQTAERAPAVSLTAPEQSTADAQSVIERFAERAFRGRTPEPEYLERLVALYEARRAQGSSFEQALKEPLGVVLASPSFLYLQEPSADAGRRKLNSFELASRLSYFLWSAPPDDELLALAQGDALQDPIVLARQVDRLIADSRSRQFASGFTQQWLGLDRLDFFQFDFRLHRSFDDSTKAASREEVYETMSYLFRENLSLRTLLKSDFVVINALLADYYGLNDVRGDHFRKVALPNDSPRGGLLGMAAILAMGGNGQSTSPVERGAWVLRKLLHDPPPPAPPNVPQLARLEGKLLNVRDRLRAHQEEPQCANCHRKIDPIGFGLENFDAAGKWRTTDIYQLKGRTKKTWPVDPSAAFYKGPSFDDYFELRDIIATKAEPFARGFTEALVEYALGRPCGFTDEDLVTSVVGRARDKDFALREFLQALVASDAFHSK